MNMCPVQPTNPQTETCDIRRPSTVCQFPQTIPVQFCTVLMCVILLSEATAIPLVMYVVGNNIWVDSKRQSKINESVKVTDLRNDVYVMVHSPFLLQAQMAKKA